MINKIILLCLPLFLFAVNNPYEQLKTDEKVNLLVNYFLNKDLKALIPPKPIKESIEDNSPINPIKYELYFSYIQRLKAINDSRKEEQKDINEKYAGKIGFHNGRLNKLKRFYEKEENIHPILQNNFNKVYKILYGKPKLKELKFNKQSGKITAIVWIDSIYNYQKWKEQEINIEIPLDIREIFLEQYRTARVYINFDYKNNILKIKDLTVKFQKKEYKATFINKINDSIKLVIKINDDIFKLAKVEE